MKTSFITSTKQIIEDRHLLAVVSLMAIVCVGFCIYAALNIQPSELQVVTHYTAFGETNFYRDKWYYLINFIAFGIISLIAYLALTFKLFTIKGRELAIPFAWVGVIVIIIAAATAYQVLKIAALS